jgi:LacI family transcriptional regulator
LRGKNGNILKRTTINDIARAVGVSAFTVSKALRGQAKVSDQIRKKILETAKDLNYIPNQSARRLVGREIRIAVIYPIEPKEFYAYWLRGVERAKMEMIDSRINIEYYPCASVTSESGYIDALEQIRETSPDGVIIINSYKNRHYRYQLDMLAEADIPVIYSVIGSDYPYPYVGHTAPDGILLGKMAAEFLYNSVKRSNKVAIFAGHAESDLHRSSIAGFKEYIMKFGLTVCGIVETEEDRAAAYRATCELLRKEPDVGGIWVTSFNAVGVCDCIEAHELAREIVVVGCDLYPALNEKLKNGSLTVTIFQDQDKLGFEAVNLLYQRISSGASVEDCTLNYPSQFVFNSMLSYFGNYL